jgi:hypothetical protein
MEEAMETTQSQAYLVIQDPDRGYFVGFGSSEWSHRLADAKRFEGKNAVKKARKVLIDVRHGDGLQDIFVVTPAKGARLPEWLVSRKSRGWFLAQVRR